LIIPKQAQQQPSPLSFVWDESNVVAAAMALTRTVFANRPLRLEHVNDFFVRTLVCAIFALVWKHQCDEGERCSRMFSDGHSLLTGLYYTIFAKLKSASNYENNLLVLHERIYDRELGIIKLLQHSLHRLLTLNVVERAERVAYDILVNFKNANNPNCHHHPKLDRIDNHFLDTLRSVASFIVVFVESCLNTDSHLSNIIHFDERAPLGLVVFIAALARASRLVDVPSNIVTLVNTHDLGKSGFLAHRFAFALADPIAKKRFKTHFAARSQNVLKWPDSELIKSSNARRCLKFL
jgi:hypothetical protein